MPLDSAIMSLCDHVRLPLLVAASAVALLAASPARAATQDWIDGLRDAPCPPAYEAFTTDPPPIEQQERALDGDFLLKGKYERLVPPVDWHMNPYDSKSWVTALQNLRWLNALFAAYRNEDYPLDKRRTALEQARDLVLDWIDANPLGGKTTAWRAWGGKRAGDRAPYVAYLTRAAACEDMVDDAQASILLDSLREHGSYLADEDVYTPSNHGLFMDLGLTLLSGYVPFWPDEASEWGVLARHRFEDTLRGRLKWAEGVWLEHSAGYQFLVLDLIEKFAGYTNNGEEELWSLLDRMWDVGGWLTMPDSRLVQFGDTELQRAPERALESARDDAGLRTYDDSGYAIVKSPLSRSYLGIAASYHNGSHKHADDLSFDLYERGRRVVSDTGIYHKDPDRFHEFDQSSRAHSVLNVDGKDFPHDGKGSYGSGIVATGRGDGWYAVWGKNPIVDEQQDVVHRRLFLYRPARALVIVDEPSSSTRRTYRRYFQIGPGIDIAKRNGDSSLGAPGFSGVLHDDESLAESKLVSVRGRDDPLLGWTFPRFRERIPRWTLRYRSEDRSPSHTATFGLDGGAVKGRTTSSSEDEIEVRIVGLGASPSTVEIVRSGDRLRVSQSALP